MNSRRSRTVVALALQLAALVALGLALFGHAWLDARSKPRVLVLVDRSESVPRAASDKARADVVQATTIGGGEVRVLAFAGRPGVLTAPTGSTESDLAASATNIEAALQAALAAHVEGRFDRVVMISDGHENVGSAARALRALRDAQLPLQWIGVGRPLPETRLAEVLAPDRALVGQRVQITVQLAGNLDRPLRVRATTRTPSGDTRAVSSDVIDQGRVKIEFDANRTGAMLVEMALEDPASGRTLDVLSNAAVIDVAARASVLYAQGSTGALARSLLRGGWSLNVVPAARLDVHADSLETYQAVVLDDVAIADASSHFWNALIAAVKDRGLGLMVLGGERSFARGGYRGSSLESLLPVLSEPASLDQPLSVVFAVDKSGSMGRGSGGVDRFQLAQRAVLETARSLTERDSLGLVVFDVAPRTLIPLTPAATGKLALERDWQTSPNGGTNLAPALEVAAAELERSNAPRRMMIVVTDGFVDETPLANLRARLDRSRIEIIALGVGPDADVSALERLVGVDAGTVFRVDQAVELPIVMRSGLERRRARVERGTIAVEQRQALPGASGMLKAWPTIMGYAVTRPRAQATVAVQSERGEPLIAFQNAGRGRVVAVTCGLGDWTPRWVQWPQWPRLAGELTDWIGGNSRGGVSLAVWDSPDALHIEADLQAGAAGPKQGSVSITVDSPTAKGGPVEADHIAPGRLQATLPDAGPGLYIFQVSTSLGVQRQLHLRRQRAESEAWGVNPALEGWRREGLVSDWNPGPQVHEAGSDRDRRPIDRSLLALGLALFMTGVLFDRATLNRARVNQVLAWWQTLSHRWGTRT